MRIQYVAVCVVVSCRVMQCVAVCCSVLRCAYMSLVPHYESCAMQCVAVCVAVSCSVLQRVAACAEWVLSHITIHVIHA